MNTKSILMPHACQKVGWWLLLLFVILWLVNVLLFRRNAAIISSSTFSFDRQMRKMDTMKVR